MGEQSFERDVVVSELLDDLNDTRLLWKPVSSNLELLVMFAWLAAASAALPERVLHIFKEALSRPWQHLDESVAAWSRLLLLDSKLPRGIFRRLFLLAALHLVQSGDKIVIQHIVVPKGDKDSEETYEYALHTTDVWDPIKDSVTGSWDDFLVKFHLNCDVHLDVAAFFIRFNRLANNVEHSFVRACSNVIKVRKLVLQIEVSRLYLEWDSLAHLSVDVQPCYSALSG